MSTNSSKPEIVILVQQHPEEPWASLRRSQQIHWIQSPLVHVVHYQGFTRRWVNVSNNVHERARWDPRLGGPTALGDRLLGRFFRHKRPGSSYDSSTDLLVADIPDLYLTAGLKFLTALEFVLANWDSPLIYRTNSSSFLNVPNLLRASRHLRANDLYAGRVVEHPLGNFLSGSSVLISRDLASAVIDHRHRWPHHRLEDVALGQVIREIGGAAQSLPSVDLAHPREVVGTPRHVLESNFHYRCKSVDAEGRRLDSEIMQELSARIRSLERPGDSQ